ncbi:MAG: malonyl-CoA decarboxylase [Candidatus Eremiobacteraeota bacterium]|nr:malonyl-CoA decarboxylase [Candidatus Eremiobacteraeota bacterium]MBV8355571.1 malonyl-CoA decarboxylase [Candidatus Eremiobacteraeota bacterium]
MAEEMRACLEGRGGEVSARARAATLGAHYRALGPAEREQFFRLLGAFGIDPDTLEDAIGGLHDAIGPAERSRRMRELRRALRPPWVELLTQFNSIPGGVKFLVDMRADLLGMLDRNPIFVEIEADLRDILASWFDVGFLELRQITWDAPAAFLEKLAKYEAVHEMRNWLDLKRRLGKNRRCFAFVHPAMPDEPLIFVEIALTSDLTANVNDILDRSKELPPLGDPEPEPTTAIFYSISNCQAGLAGVSFGNALIKRVVDRLSAERRSLKTFATLSPIPGFLQWLEGELGEDPQGIAATLARRAWYKDPATAESLRAPLLRLCARYLLKEKRGDQRALNSVEHFHLSNGARLERINWLADASPRGLRESAGMMTNYLYVRDQIDENHEAYVGEGRIAASSRVQDLLRSR